MENKHDQVPIGVIPETPKHKASQQSFGFYLLWGSLASVSIAVATSCGMIPLMIANVDGGLDPISNRYWLFVILIGVIALISSGLILRKNAAAPKIARLLLAIAPVAFAVMLLNIVVSIGYAVVALSWR